MALILPPLSFLNYCYIFQAVTCDDPGENHFSVKSGDSFDYNMVVNYTCKTGFASSNGSSLASRTCGADGKWSNLELCEGKLLLT